MYRQTKYRKGKNLLSLIKLKVGKVLFCAVGLSALIPLPTVFADTEYKVKSTDNLSRIVNKFYKDSKLKNDQVFIALLAENPNAFKFGNINYLRSGHLLTLPAKSDLLLMDEGDASSLVREHNAYAKEGKKIKLSAPFTDYSPENTSLKTGSENGLAQKQQSAILQLENISTETEELRIRLEQLEADKRAMDAELKQLDSLLLKE